MKKKIWAVLGRLLLLALFASPFVYVYYFLTDPVNAIAYTIGAWLWLIIVIVPSILILAILWAFFGLIKGLLYSIYDLIKSFFK